MLPWGDGAVRVCWKGETLSQECCEDARSDQGERKDRQT